jgi:hypothetical protein
MKNFNSHLQEFSVFSSIKPSFAFDDSQNFTDWQTRAREKLNELLGLPLDRCDGNLEIEYEKDFEDHTEYRFTVQTEPGYYVPCHLLLPKSGGDKIPLMICLSGHGAGMHIALGTPKTEKDEASLREWPHRAMAPRAIKEGRAALVIEARNFGESSLHLLVYYLLNVVAFKTQYLLVVRNRLFKTLHCDTQVLDVRNFHNFLVFNVINCIMLVVFVPSHARTLYARTFNPQI